MDRAEVKRRLLAGLATPAVEDDVVWSVLAECRTESTGSPHRVVDLMESVQPTDGHARMRALLEASDTPRSDLKDLVVDSPDHDPYLPPGVDIAGAIRRAAEGYKRDGVALNPPITKRQPITLAESRADLAQRVLDPIERAYIILSGRDR
jgi:hypothetical protein